jgi:NTE family protein
VLRPHYYEGRTLVDGGLLNPVPITPTLRDLTDCTFAVDVNAPAEQFGESSDTSTTAATDSTFGSVAGVLIDESSPVQASQPDVEAAPEAAGEATLPSIEPPPPSYAQRITDFINGLVERREAKPAAADDPGLLELFARSLDVVQETITRFKLAAQPPDLIIRIPRNVCAFYEFHRAEEVIELGRERTREALLHWQRPKPRASSSARGLASSRNGDIGNGS